MTLEELQTIFKYQTTEEKEYIPSGVLNYLLIDVDNQSKTILEHKLTELATLLPILSEYEHDGYRDRMPIFIKPSASL